MYAVEGDVGGCLEDNGVVFIEVEGGVVVGVEKVVEGVGEEGGEGVVTRERGGMRKRRRRRRRSGRGEGVGGKGGGGEVKEDEKIPRDVADVNFLIANLRRSPDTPIPPPPHPPTSHQHQPVIAAYSILSITSNFASLFGYHSSIRSPLSTISLRKYNNTKRNKNTKRGNKQTKERRQYNALDTNHKTITNR
ncbi:hypothetical protein C8R41DRAFT_920089 [Lentinula lateritia]|uniref:Uncharacterized protein n=1 Tax=Lentinula lateritia TaxID=40482 RepID=A0ABQ8VF99_9AGAR|nr:hypothetical protein C8R41DRAFT_920089 [Lentinula lateritia]